jgi:hypothetical protein
MQNYFLAAKERREHKGFYTNSTNFHKLEACFFHIPPALPAKPMAGQARPATGKYQRAIGDLLSWGERIKGEGERHLSQQNMEPFWPPNRTKGA